METLEWEEERFKEVERRSRGRALRSSSIRKLTIAGSLVDNQVNLRPEVGKGFADSGHCRIGGSWKKPASERFLLLRRNVWYLSSSVDLENHLLAAPGAVSACGRDSNSSKARVCSPHSFFPSCSHHQRPARISSPGLVGRVQQAQPMLR